MAKRIPSFIIEVEIFRDYLQFKAMNQGLLGSFLIFA